MMTDSADFGDERPLMRSMARGLACSCPRCGQGAIFDGYLRVARQCGSCGLDLSGHRADDLPPYLTILAAGKISIAALLAIDSAARPSVFWLTVIVVALAVALCLLLIRPFKGLVIGVQWANQMHGFDPDGDAHAAPIDP